MSFENKLERNKEIFIKSEIEVDFIRHGEALYDDSELKSGKLEGEITSSGVIQIRDLGDRLAREINKNEEIIIVWTSPKKRAVQSAAILKERMEAAGLEVYRVRTKKPLRDVELGSEFEENIENENTKWIDYWVENPKYFSDTEKIEDLNLRTGRIISCINRIARNINSIKGKKMRFLCVGHEENIGGIIGHGFSKHIPFVETDNAELVRIYFNKTEKGKDIKLNINFKNQQIAVGFDENKKTFYKF